MDAIEGTLRIVRFDDESGYAALFAPTHGGGGALPQLRLPTRGALSAFLLDMGLSQTTTEEILADLAHAPTVSRHIAAPVEMLRRYELLQLSVIESILRYLTV